MDLRIDCIFNEEMKGDTSFTEKDHPLSVIFGRTKYHQSDMRDCWHRGIKHGIEIGLMRASIEGQKIELNQNTPEGKSKEFLEKFYQLAAEYNCAIQYHPIHGMVVVNRD